MNPLIHFSIKSSRYFACLLLLCYSGGAISLFTSQAPWELKWIGWIVATFIFLRYLSRFVLLQSPQAITEIRFDQTGMGWLLTRHEEFFSAHLVGDSFLKAHFVVLNFRRDKKSCIVPIVLFPDAVDSATFRRLKVYLFTNSNFSQKA
jgi:Membrane-bound toxin component of toxin-antitoxin system